MKLWRDEACREVHYESDRLRVIRGPAKVKAQSGPFVPFWDALSCCKTVVENVRRAPEGVEVPEYGWCISVR